MARQPKDGMVYMRVQVRKTTRDALQRIWHTSGLTVSQQVRTSLEFWVQAHEKNPDRTARRGAAQTLRDSQITSGTGPRAPRINDLEPLGPEPDRQADPVAWSKWSARAGNAAIAKLARGEWPDDQD